jgi:transcriptional regulator
MYTPKAFALDDFEAQAGIIRNHPFGTLVTQGDDGLHATHLPFLLHLRDDGSGILAGHMARQNPQLTQTDRPVLVVFTGPHAYVSPRWYQTPNLVPTWNYVAVHVHGTMSLVADADATERHLDALIARFETGEPPIIPAETRAKLLPGIQAFEIAIARIEGKAKLSQNRLAADRKGVITGLLDEGDDDGRHMAERMMELD